MSSYNALLKAHFFETQNLFDEKIDNVNDFIESSVGSINLGDQITLYIKCCQTTKIIQKIKFQVYGNPYLIASLSYMSEKLTNKPVSIALNFSSEELINVFEIPATKKYSAYMVEDAIKQAIQSVCEIKDRKL